MFDGGTVSYSGLVRASQTFRMLSALQSCAEAYEPGAVGAAGVSARRFAPRSSRRCSRYRPRPRRNGGAPPTTASLTRRLRPACPTTAIRPASANGSRDRGVVFGLEYTNDVLSNLRGGLRTGTIDQGKLQGILTVDFGKLAGLARPDGFRQRLPDPQHRPHPPRLRRRRSTPSPRSKRCRPRGFRKSGSSRSSPTARPASGSASSPPTPSSSSAAISTSFLQSDWPTIFAVNLPSGGPAYPLSTPGVRLKVEPASGRVRLLMAVFNGDPAGPASPATSSFATVTASTSGSAIRRLSSARRSFSATPAPRIPASPPR